MTDLLLVTYASKRGSTQEVAEAIAERLRSHGLQIELRPAAEVDRLEDYAGVVLGGALYTGRLHKDARRFLRRHRDRLASLPFAVFAMGPKTLAEAELASSRAQLDRALAEVPDIEPVSVAIFGGAVDPAKLRFPFNRMPATDARDWSAIRAWADEVASLLVASAAELPLSGEALTPSVSG